MSKRPFVLFGLLALVCVILLPILAMGKETSPETGAVQVASRDTESRDLFQNNCGSCHTLDAAGTDGVVGPDLDELLITSGVNSDTQFEGLYQRVIQIVLCGREGRMPRGILEGENASEVATFVAAYAGQVGAGPTVDTDSVEKPEAPSSCQGGASGDSGSQ